MLWHQILGHIKERGLRLLDGKGMVKDLSNFSLDFAEGSSVWNFV
jgi:hypothetical protein